MNFDYKITKDKNDYFWELIASYPGCNEDSGYSGLDSDYWTKETVSSGYAASEELAIEAAENKLQEYKDIHSDDEED